MKKFIKKPFERLKSGTVAILFIFPAVMLMMAGSFSSCTRNEEPPQQISIDEWCSNIKITNASEYKNVVEVKLLAYDVNAIRITNGHSYNGRYIELASFDWKDEGFTIELPESLDSNYLRPLVTNGWQVSIDLGSGIIISNENAKVADILFAGVDKDGHVVATFSPINYKRSDINLTEAIFTYVDSDVTIFGYNFAQGHCFPAFLGAPSWVERTTTYSVQWQKGWNVWFHTKQSSEEGYILYEEVKWSTNPVSNLKWYGRECDFLEYI